MRGTWSLLRTLLIPAIVSLLLYLCISYLIVPLWQRYQDHYSRYLPLQSITSHTISFRQRLQNAIIRLLVPSSWSVEWDLRRYTEHGEDASGSDYDEDDGEELYDVAERREGLSLDARRGGVIGEEDRRLSRDLEAGFKDDSDDDDEEETDTGRGGRVIIVGR